MRIRYGAVLLLVGIGLLLNPLYLYPGGGGQTELTYSPQQIGNESTALQTLGTSEEVLACPRERSCALEQEILRSGGVRVESQVRNHGYEVVSANGSYYLPANESVEGGVVLTLTELQPMEAVRASAVDAEQTFPRFGEAVDDGSTTVLTDREEQLIAETGSVLSYDGEYYRIDGYRVSSHWTGGGTLALVRGVLWVSGMVLIAIAFYAKDER
jgi:hypothetical protein